MSEGGRGDPFSPPWQSDESLGRSVGVGDLGGERKAPSVDSPTWEFSIC